MALDFEELFVIAPQWLLFDGTEYPNRITSGLSDGAFRLYAVLQSYADRDSQKATPSRSALAKALGCSTKTVDRRVDELIEFGALVKKHRFDDAGDYTSNDWLVRTRPEETLWTTVSRGSDKNVATVEPSASLPVASKLTPKEDPRELDPTNYRGGGRDDYVADPKELVEAWAEKTSTPLTKTLKRKWYPIAVEFVEAAPNELLERVDSFLDYCVREGCRSPKGWAAFAAGYSRALRLAGIAGPSLATVEPNPDDWDEVDVRSVLGMRTDESGRDFLERTAREQAS